MLILYFYKYSPLMMFFFDFPHDFVYCKLASFCTTLYIQWIFLLQLINLKYIMYVLRKSWNLLELFTLVGSQHRRASSVYPKLCSERREGWRRQPDGVHIHRMSTDKNRNYAVLAGTITALSALGWYLLSKEPKKTEEIVD